MYLFVLQNFDKLTNPDAVFVTTSRVSATCLVFKKGWKIRSMVTCTHVIQLSFLSNRKPRTPSLYTAKPSQATIPATCGKSNISLEPQFHDTTSSKNWFRETHVSLSQNSHSIKFEAPSFTFPTTVMRNVGKFD